jgi:hypothetical protein
MASNVSNESSCNGCGKQSNEGHLVCGQCQTAHYCSRDCQKKHWKIHKTECEPSVSIVDQFWKFVEQANQDYALTPDEYQRMRWMVNRFAGSLNTMSYETIDDPVINMKIAVCCLLDSLLAEGRGVRLSGLPTNKKAFEGSIAYVVKHIGGKAGPSRSYKVQLEDGSTTLTLAPEQLRMIPLNDPRHWKPAFEFEQFPDKIFPPEADPGWCNRQRQYIPVTPGYKWEFLDLEDDTWKEYTEPVQYLIESLYDMGSNHCLYRPGAPHCEGQIREMSGVPTTDPREYWVGHIDLSMQVHHDASTRQIVFSEQTESHKPIMTERDLFTGLRRPVRRSGPLPPAANDYIYERSKCGPEYHFKDNSKNVGTFCGLCYSIEGPFVKTKCCTRWVCDTEGNYATGSRDRDGRCERNHQLGSICGWHHQEGHAGDWKDCSLCQDFFHPFDYAVKASSQSKGSTNRRYNFDDNVRHDLDPTKADFPSCDTCGAPVDTTEEITKTLMMRNAMAGGKNFCKKHQGGFGKIKNLMTSAQRS